MPDNNTEKMNEDELWAAISSLELILDVMPEDKTSLQALAGAYVDIGDISKAVKLKVRLGQLCLNSKSMVEAAEIFEELVDFRENDDDVKEFLERYESMKDVVQDEGAGGEAVEAVASVIDSDNYDFRDLEKPFDISKEISLAWEIFQEKLMTEQEYSAIVRDLTEMTVSQSVITVSTLHAIQSREYTTIENIIAYLGVTYNAPFVNISSFNLQEDVLKLLPVRMMIKYGILPFDVVGENSLLLVVMNPADKKLLGKIEKILNKKCFIYTTYPHEFDQILMQLHNADLKKKATADKANADK
jgi:tetratricopeptide (TPR) repeat protein